MHKQAYSEAEKFYKEYLSTLPAPLKVLDIGSQDINGSLRPIFHHHHYTGLDMQSGNNVDIVATDLEKLPFSDNEFDVVVSSSCFEHNPVFWITFQEMVRITRKGGFIYINTPSEGGYHGYPSDCWRFLADAYKALEATAPQAHLITSYICHNDPWKDNVGIFEIK